MNRGTTHRIQKPPTEAPTGTQAQNDNPQRLHQAVDLVNADRGEKHPKRFLNPKHPRGFLKQKHHKRFLKQKFYNN